MQKLELRSIKLSEWPSSWRDLWLEAKKPAESPFDDAGLAAGWSLAMQSQVERAVGVYLCWLGDIDPNRSLDSYVDRAALKAFLAAYAPGRAETTIAAAVRGVAYYLRATAPPNGLPWLTKLAHRMSNRAQPSRPKLPRMAPVSELLELGIRLMSDGLQDHSEGRTHGAWTYRNGLMIAALAARPTLRLKNFQALRINHTFFENGGRYEARVPRSQTKKKRAISFLYPDWMTDPFQIYVERIRPHLPDGGLVGDQGWLWIGRNGPQPLLIETVSSILSKVTERHLGRPTSPHLFRDCAATDVALLAPQDVGITKDVLGHATLASSQAHYNQAQSFTALTRLESVLLDLIDDE